jgi:hypothetical protein
LGFNDDFVRIELIEIFQSILGSVGYLIEGVVGDFLACGGLSLGIA